MKITLEKPVYGGDCLGHAENGKAIFVPLTLPGETISGRIVEDKRSFAKAEVEELLSASPNRIAPPCQHFGLCGGCHYQHTGYPTQLAMKQQILRETLERASVSVPSKIEWLCKDAWLYRNRIRLAINELGQPGYRGRRSHAIIPIAGCPIASPLLLTVAELVTTHLQEFPSPVAVGEIELFGNCDESQLLLTLFCESAEPIPGEPMPDDLASDWLTRLSQALPAAVSGLRLQVDDGRLEPLVLASAGNSSLSYTAAGFPYQVDHGAFFQVNRWLVDDLVALVTGGHAGQLAWDLYAGVGLFARPLTNAFDQVLAVESAGPSFAALRQNLAGTCGKAVGSTTLDFLRRNRQEREPRPDLIVLDPPRAGLGEEVTLLLNAIYAPEIIYVSCDPATLARDLRALTQERYRIESITQADMFPQTFHMETLVRLLPA